MSPNRRATSLEEQDDLNSHLLTDVPSRPARPTPFRFSNLDVSEIFVSVGPLSPQDYSSPPKAARKHAAGCI